jgi:hypothetical protein
MDDTTEFFDTLGVLDEMEEIISTLENEEEELVLDLDDGDEKDA